jgi:lysosomal acid lipase/cholesteryl ester hydrolase
LLSVVNRAVQAYWNWAWDDLVLQDLPSMLRFVHAQSRQTIYFVGYSQVMSFEISTCKFSQP